MTRSVIIFFIIFLSIDGFTQETYSKVRIDLKKTDLQSLNKLGLETDHGTYHPNVSFVNVFSATEIAIMERAGIETHIEIEDMIKHYQNNQHNHEVRNSECEVISVENNYDTPFNYKSGSMGGFLTYTEMLAELDRMADLYPDIITIKDTVSQTPTHDNNFLHYVKISDNPYMDEDEPEVLYTALHHAREPASMSQMMFYLWYLLENYEKNPAIKYLIDHTQMYFIPCLNPDGYQYNESEFPEGGGLWRKNRLPNNDHNLIGVDLNRNYGYKWGYNDSGSSPEPISNVYRGPAPFSEPETQAVRNFCVAHNFIITFNYHAHGELLLHPWGYESLLTADNYIFKTLGNTMVKENGYNLGTPLETVGYNANGNSDDWFYGDTTEKDHIYAYTPEVGDAFWPMESQIDGINKDNMWQNLSMAKSVHNFYDHELLRFPNNYGESTLNLDLSVRKAGLKDGDANIVIITSSEYLEIENFTFPMSLIFGENETIELEFNIDPSTPAYEVLSFYVQVDNGEFIEEKKYSFTYIVSEDATIISDNLDAISNWNSEGMWAITTETFLSEPSSITDSPGGEYDNNINSVLLLSDPIDLSDMDRAELLFNAKWDIEEGFDYVILEVSTDGSLWIPQCGNHTTLGTTNQLSGTPLYDGVVENWVDESINLSDYVGEEIWIRFTLVTDGLITSDGMYIDDFLVIGSKDINTTTVETELDNLINVYPTHTSEYVIIELDANLDIKGARFEILGIDGSLLKAEKITDHTTKLILPSHFNTTVMIKITTESGTTTKKIIKL